MSWFKSFSLALGLGLLLAGLALAQKNCAEPRGPGPGTRTQVVSSGRRLRSQSVRGRSAAGQADPDQFRSGRPAVGRQQRRPIRRSSRARSRTTRSSFSKTRKGAGHADKTTVFADGLLIPTGVMPGDGGVYVANSTELLFISRSPKAPGQCRQAPRHALRLRHRGHAPHSPHAPLGPRRLAVLATNRSTSTATSKRPTACAA